MSRNCAIVMLMVSVFVLNSASTVEAVPTPMLIPVAGCCAGPDCWACSHTPGEFRPRVKTYPPLVIRVGEALQWGLFQFEDLDCLPDDPNEPGWPYEPTIVEDDSVKIWHVSFCEPCGFVSEYSEGGERDYRGWSPSVPGTYRVGILINDDCQNSPNDCCSDEPVAVWFTVLVLGDQEWRDRHPFNPGAGLGLGTQGLLKTFSLGTTYDGESAGALEIAADAPGPSLAQPASLKYPFENPNDPNHAAYKPGVFVYRHGAYDEFQVKTPHLIVDVQRIDAFSYTIGYYALNQLGTWQGDHYALTGNPYRKYEIENPDGGSSDDRLFITESVLENSSYTERATYEYDAFGVFGGTPPSTHGWELAIKQGTSLYASAVLTIEPTTNPSGFVRTLVVSDPWDGATYEETETWEQFTPFGATWPVTLPVERVVDPSGAALTTQWGYDTTTNDLRLASEKRPDGSWTWYLHGYDSPGQGEATFTEISGWGDTQCPSTPPTVGTAGTRSARTVYLLPDGGNPGRLESVEEWIEDVLVRKSEFAYGWNVECQYGSCVGRIEQQWLDAEGTVRLESYRVDPPPSENANRPITVIDTDKQRRDYVYDDEITFTPSQNLPYYPSSYVLTGNNGYRYRETTYGYDDGGLSLVAGKSTRRVLISDAGGLPYLAETWVYSDSVWARIAWTEWTYDVQQRVTGIYRHDGTYQTIDYTSCCNRVVTDSTGVSTTYTFDPLGRVASVTRAEIPTYGDYPAQAAIQTTFTYGDPVNAGRITVSTSAGGLTETTYQDFDLAGRLIGVTTGFGDGQFKTIYEYGSTGAGGRKVTVYENYPPAATQGTPGTRDRITEYYRDGQVKSVTGATVVPTYYAYGADEADGRWTKVGTLDVPGVAVRYVTTTYDMLGRVRTTERPGVTSALTTTYYYDDGEGPASTGRLKRIDHPTGADTVFEYDPLGRVTRTGLDVNGNGLADPNSTDRLTDTDAKYEQYQGAWWWVTRSSVYPNDNDPNAVETGSRWQRVSGHTDGIIRESRLVDALNNLTTTARTTLDRDHALVTETTWYPDGDPSKPAQRFLRGGRLQREQSKSAVLTVYGYDALGRRTTVTDARGNVTETAYDASGRPVWVEDGANHRTEYGYYVSGDAFPGQLKYVENPDDKRAYYAYNARGQTTRVWGDVPNPTETVYDDYGQRVALKTFRGGTWTGSTWPDPAPDADQTQWFYDDATGLLEEKQYADETSTTYTYTNDGKLHTRTWARGVVTTYAYDPNTAELTGITYSDGTTAVGFQYDRLGRRKQVVDAVGTRVFTYNAALQPATETFQTAQGNLFSGQVITQLYQDGTAGTVRGRFRGVQVGNPSVYYTATYGYDAVGRLNHVTGPGLPTGDGTYNGAWYGFLSGTDLLDTLQFKDSSDLVRAWTEWEYDQHRDLVTRRLNMWGDETTVISQYDYAYDHLDLRTHNQRSGAAFTASFYEVYDYNDRQELIDSDYLTGTYNTGTPAPDGDLAYTYDPIGNRGTFVEDPNAPGATTDYYLNELNQYHRSRRFVSVQTPIVAQGFRYDGDGNLAETFISGDMNCDGQINFADVNAFVLAVSNPAGYAAAYPNCNILNGDINGDGLVDYGDVNAFVALLGHTAGGVGLRSEYIWDAENRLVEVRPTNGTQVYGDKKVKFWYDYLGRCAQKEVQTWTAGSPPDYVVTERRKFMYHGWLPILELDGLVYDEVLRAYTWGLDLSGTLDGLAGVGGLLAVKAPGAGPSGGNLSALYMHDAGGNVGQLVAWTTNFDQASGNAWHACRLIARYEYDPYGRIVGPDTNADGKFDEQDDPGFYAGPNPFRGSTKRFDPETGLSDFGLRYYSATLGRWINRDPIGDFGGANVYAYVGNNPTNRTDYLGMMYIPCPPGQPCDDEGSSSDPPSQEENDKKPCPRRPDLYQQSQPTTRPVPDLSDDWQPPKPYGTCKDCASECNKDDAKQAKAFGVTRTEGGTKCYCICTTRIYGDPPLRGHPGLTLANQIIEGCTVRHEQIHVANGPSENQPDADSASCISDGLDQCTSSGLDQSQMCRCLNRLDYVLDMNVNCDSKGADQTKCKEQKAATKKKYLDLKKQHKCKS